MTKLVALALLCALTSARGANLKEKTEFGANPVRRVVTMLQMMAKKVEADGKKQEERSSVKSRDR